MDLLESLAFSFGLLGLIAFSILAMGLRRGAPDGRVLLHPMLARQGDDVARIATASARRGLATLAKRPRWT